MNDEQAKGTANKVQGKVQETLGKLTGDTHEQAKGKARQAQGSAQVGLGNVQDATRRRGPR
jgi:uncharacterized protein YjbJ (UPF0337 family)